MRSERTDPVVVLWYMAIGWFCLVVFSALVSVVDPTGPVRDGNAFGVLRLVVGTMILGLAPAALLFRYRKSLERKLHQAKSGLHTPVVPPVPAPTVYPAAYPAQLPSPLPPRLQGSWDRLAQAWNVVLELQRQGWVDPDSTRGLPQSMVRLYQLAVADGMTDHLGGRQSGSVERQLERLADLLVALADEAVEHQAAISAGDYTPATVAAAAERLAADRAAYRELMELSGAWKIPDQQ